MDSRSTAKVFSSTKVVGLFLPGEIFSVREKFVISIGSDAPVKFNWVDERFLYYFGMFPCGVEQRIVLLNCHVLAELTSTSKMFEGIGGAEDEDSFVTAPEVYSLLLAHAGDRDKCDLSSVHGNIFFLQGSHGISWILNLIWCKGSGWMATFCEGLIPHEWLKETRVFSRHKLRPAV